MELRCPKPCNSGRIRATGRTVYNRRRRLCAIVQCQSCGYSWPSSHPEAMERCRTLLEAAGESMPDPTRHETQQPSWRGNPMPSLPETRGFSSTVDVLKHHPVASRLARDAKLAAAGDSE